MGISTKESYSSFLLKIYMRMPRFLFLTSILVLSPTIAFAQAGRTSSAEPARMQEQLRIEEPRPDVGGAPVIIMQDDHGKDMKMGQGVSFTLKSVTLQNATVFTPEHLKRLYADKIGQKVTLKDLYDLAATITAEYRNAGFILSRAVVPKQRIHDGAVTLQVVEGFVDQVVVEGENTNSSLIRAYADKIKNSHPLNTATLERYLLLIQDLPGVTARAVLRPSATVPGASDVVISVSEKKVDGSVSADNRSTRYLGPYEGGVTANLNNLLGVYDRTQLRGTVSADPSELQFFQVSHDEQIGTEGTKATVTAAHTRTRPSFRLEAFSIDGEDTLVSASVLHPFIRSRQSNLFGNASFDIRRTSSSSFDVPLYDDRLKVGRLGGSYDFVDRFTGVTRFDGQLSKGFGWDVDSGSGLRSRNNGRPSFWKANAQVNRLQTISGPFAFQLSGEGQLASAALLSAEQFGLGGQQFLSAYDPSEVTGDSGIAGRGELQYNQSDVFRYLAAYQLYTFYDIGKVWTRNPSAGLKSSVSLASAGAGVRFNISAPLSGSFEVALPLTKDVNANRPNHGDDARAFFSLAYRF